MAVGVGQDENTLPFVPSANLARSEMTPFRMPPCFGKIMEDEWKGSANKPTDIFKADKSRAAFLRKLPEAIPKPALILGPALLSGLTVRLTGDAANDAVHHASKAICSDIFEIACPKRSWLQGRFFHPRHEDGRSAGFPLTVTHMLHPDSVPFAGKAESFVQHGRS